MQYLVMVNMACVCSECQGMQFDRQFLKFRTNQLPPSSRYNVFPGYKSRKFIENVGKLLPACTVKYKKREDTIFLDFSFRPSDGNVSALFLSVILSISINKRTPYLCNFPDFQSSGNGLGQSANK